MTHYLDDFLLAGNQDYSFFMSNLRAICAELGVPITEEKMLSPSVRLVYLGLEINTLNMTVKISSDKLEH